ncbi:MAG: hypothetical protein H6Q73_3795 [Firmicutes bacterium]|nr:hypothetical protein [Bacillota bacterium]
MPDRIFNYYALALAICNLNYSIDLAIDYFLPQQQKQRKIPQEVVGEMARLKESGQTYKQIGAMYGINADAVYTRIRRYKGVI